MFATASYCSSWFILFWIALSILPNLNDTVPIREKYLTTNLKREKRQDKDCTLPNFPQNGNYSILGVSNVAITPGETVAPYTVIKYTCQEGYTLNPRDNSILLCNSALQSWDKAIPECVKEEKGCPLPEVPQNGLYKIVGIDLISVKPHEIVSPFTVLQFSCEKGYELFPNNKVLLCTGDDYVWDKSVPECIAKPDTISTPEPVSKIGCTIPEKPTNGEYNIPRSNISLIPGQTVPPYTPIHFSCQKGYKLYPENMFLVCLDNFNWDKTVPECRRTCSSLISSHSTAVKCSLDDKSLNNCLEPVEGTKAIFYCENFYEPVNSYSSNIAKCHGGSWDRPPFECTPVCGRRKGQGQVNIINGNTADPHEFPWHVGIYKSSTKEYICGGSLISANLIISAAHCFTDAKNGKAFPKENYSIAAGKYYREYSDPRDQENVQYPTIREILVHPQYKGEVRHHEADFALIQLNDPLSVSLYVQPVCIKWNNFNKFEDLYENSTGLVIGWGWTTEGGNPAEELQFLEVPYVPQQKCYDNVPEAFKYYITHDKLCAGTKNKGSSSCRGDSGGGLVFKQTWSPSEKRYFLRGITSVSAVSTQVVNGCDSNNYIGYTDITLNRYTDFINEFKL